MAKQYIYCPYFGCKKEKSIYCEAGRVSPPTPNMIAEFITNYCANKEKYKECTFCKMLDEYYERTYNNV